MEKLPAKDILKILSKQWCSSNDFKILSNTGKNTTLKLMKQLKEQLEQDNYFLPKSGLPMDKVVDFLKINIPYLEKVSDFEESNKLKGTDNGNERRCN